LHLENHIIDYGGGPSKLLVACNFFGDYVLLFIQVLYLEGGWCILKLLVKWGFHFAHLFIKVRKVGKVISRGFR
jgi:hypothetical protein